MIKKTNLGITVHLPQDNKPKKMAITPDGGVHIFDSSGKEIVPPMVERHAHYERPKGVKYQSSAVIDNVTASVNGLEALGKYNSFVVVDTNSMVFAGTKVSAAFFVACRLEREQNSFRLVSLDNCGHVYEFHNVTGNPEMLAILKIANDTVRGGHSSQGAVTAFVTDSELGRHPEINRHEEAIYGGQELPPGFNLIYASSDTGRELTNQLIKFCDKESKKYLNKLQEGGLRVTGMAVLDEDTDVRFRYTYFPSLTISNSVVTGLEMTPETKYSVQFHGNQNKESDK